MRIISVIISLILMINLSAWSVYAEQAYLGESSSIAQDEYKINNYEFGNYALDSSFEVSDGFKVVEDFEDERFEMTFLTTGNLGKSWIRSNVQKNSGNYSFKNPSMSKNKTSGIKFNVTVPSGLKGPTELSFSYMMSTGTTDKFQFILNGTEMVNQTGTSSWTPYNVVLPEGTNSVEFLFTRVSNKATGDDCVYIDDLLIRNLSAGSTSGNYIKDGWVNKDVAVVISGTGIINYNLNNSGWNKGLENTASVNVVTEGMHNLKFKAVNETGVLESSVSEINFGIDITAPTSPTINKSKTGFTITPGGDTLSGVKETRYSINDESWLLYTDEVALAGGTYNIQAKTIDNAGNESEITSVSITTEGPEAPKTPVVTGDYIENGWVNRKAIFNIEYENDLMYQLNNSDWFGFSAEVKEVSSTGRSTLILLENGDVYSCGYDSYGQLGLGNDSGEYVTVPTKIENLSNVKSVSVGEDHSLVLLENGDVYSFGYNLDGQLGLGDNTNKNVPTKIESLSNVKAISAGGYHSLILLENGEVYSFGANNFGQLGLGVNTDTNVPTKINSLSNVRSIEAGESYSLVLLENGDVYGFGHNLRGQLGLGHYYSRFVPTKIESLSNVKAISAGGYHSLILLENGDVYSFGDDMDRQLGLEYYITKDSESGRINVPTKIQSISNAKLISAGYNHSLISLENGDIYSFGGNEYGQLGLGHYTFIDIPTKISTITNPKAVTAGYNCSMIVSENGEVYSCGYAEGGHIGLNEYTTSIPTKIKIPSSVMSPSVLEILEEGYHNIKFKSVDYSTSLESDIVEFNFGIDMTKPTNPIINKTTNGFTITPGGDTLSGVKETRYSINDESWLLYTDEVNLEDGTYNIKAKTIDNAGNESEITSVSITIEGAEAPKSPVVTGNYAEDSWVNHDVVIDVKSDHSIYYNLNDSGWEHLDKIKDISAGNYHSLILLENGDVYSFGKNADGQLGLGNNIEANIPTKIESLSNVKAISAGGNHSLILLENGDVYSFGTNRCGELGLGNYTATNVPTKIESLSNVKSISAGDNHSLILLENGDVYSFGYNFCGQLGLGISDKTIVVPRKIDSLNNAKAISAGNSYSLVLLENGDVYSFGNNPSGELGVGNTSVQKVPNKIESLSNVKSISAGGSHSLILLENGDVYSCGDNRDGQLGLGNNINVSIPNKIESLSDVRSVAAGNSYSLVLLENGDVYSFGYNSHGWLGLGNNINVNIPTKIESLSNAKAMEAGFNRSLILLENGDVYSFGNNYYGHLGLGNNISTNVPTEITYFDINVREEKYHTLQVKAKNETTLLESDITTINFGIDKTAPKTPTITKTEKGFTIKDNGDNLSGIKEILYQINNNEWTEYTSEVILENKNCSIRAKVIDTAGNESEISEIAYASGNYVKDGWVNHDVELSIDSIKNITYDFNNSGWEYANKIKDVSAGYSYTLVLLNNGDVYSVGNNTSGQLGLGDNAHRNIPTKIETLSKVKAISAGGEHSLILLENGDVYSCGDNYFGQLGLGNNIDVNAPTKIESISNAKAISAGAYYSLILLENGDVYSCGNNYYGQLGLGNNAHRNIPTKIETLSKVKAIEAGGEHSLILLENGDVYSFGYNGDGELGLGNNTDTNIPTKIESLNDVKTISAVGGYHSLILLENGDVYSFGDNDDGQLGLGNNIDANIPTKIESLSNIKSISAGGYHSLILLENGDVYSFGGNSNGQLGLGNNTGTNIPTKIESLCNIKVIIGGNKESFVQLQNGDMYSFGYNQDGNLCIGNQINQDTPTRVPIFDNVVVEHKLKLSEEKYHNLKIKPVYIDEDFESVVTEINFGIDKTVPLMPTMTKKNNKVILSHNGDLLSGVKEIQYRENESTWKVYTGEIALKGDATVIEAKVIDNAGNESLVVKEEFMLDTLEVSIGSNTIDFGEVAFGGSSEKDISLDVTSTFDYTISILAEENFKNEVDEELSIENLNVKVDSNEKIPLELSEYVYIKTDGLNGNNKHILNFSLDNVKVNNTGLYRTALKIVVGEK